MNTPANFNIRVYAIIINEQNQLLVADEHLLGMLMTKFPGGGLEFGEGTIECLKREAIEEMGQTIEIIDHFYTTDFFQPALFFDNTQLISIYYRARLTHYDQLKLATSPITKEMPEGTILFRWVSIDDFKVYEMTFPIDQHVMKMIKNDNNQSIR